MMLELITPKAKPHMTRGKVFNDSFLWTPKQEQSTQRILWNLSKHATNWHGLTTHPLHIDLRPVEVLKEHSTESKKVLLL